MTNLVNFFKIYKSSIIKVPAYSKFLKSKSFKKRFIRNYNDWLNIPVSNKDNYINKYSINERYGCKKIPPIIYGSSGSTGIPIYWYGNDVQELISARSHERLFNEMFNIKKDTNTLMIICFAMGIWIAPHHTIAACRYLNKKGYNFSVITPGYSMQDIIDIFKNLTKYYDKLIIAAHPGFAMDIVKKLSKLNLINKKNDIRIIVTGDKISEKWRKDITKLLKKNDFFNTVSAIYGSTDAGMMGYETQFTNYLMYLINKYKFFKNDLVGISNFEPSIYQFNPNNIFFENLNNELLVTVNTAIPLVRYNTHDVGNTISYKKIIDLLKKHNFYKIAKKFGVNTWKLPILLLYGRSNVAVTFYALHIYPDSIKKGLCKGSVIKNVTGNYFAYKKINKSKIEQLHINIELKRNIENTKKLYEEIKNSLIKSLEMSNIEYRKLKSMIGIKADPILHLYSYDSFRSKPKNRNSLLQLNNYKPKVIL